MKLSKTLLVLILSISFPITQVYAVVPDTHSVISDVTESQGKIQDVNIPAPKAKFYQSQLSDITAAISQDTITDENAVDTKIEEEEQILDSLTISGNRFWTRNKIIVGSAILLSAGLLLSLLIASLSGGSSGSGAGCYQRICD